MPFGASARRATPLYAIAHSGIAYSTVARKPAQKPMLGAGTGAYVLTVWGGACADVRRSAPQFAIPSALLSFAKIMEITAETESAPSTAHERALRTQNAQAIIDLFKLSPRSPRLCGDP